MGAPTTPEATPGPVAIRLAERRDADAIRTIYNREVMASTVTFDMVPRTLDEQVQWIDEHSGGHPAVVAELGVEAGAESDGRLVVGFGSLTPYRPRPAYATTVENSVYVDPGYQGRGVGKAILDELVRIAADHGFHSVVARIVGGHEASIALHAACGFETVGVEREVGRKFSRWLDVVVMQRML
jgi:phosphinothricin acetyltransferase